MGVVTDTIRIWAGIWKWVLYIGCFAFLSLMVFVIIKGIFDIRALFATLRGSSAPAEPGQEEHQQERT